MPNARFQETLKKLSIIHRDRVKKELELWKSSSVIDGNDSAQLAKNIEAECGLSISTFTKLLKSFSINLEKDPDSIKAWVDSCADYELTGSIIPSSLRPDQLGRAAKLGSYANHLQKNAPKFAVSHLLIKNAGKKKPLSALIRHMHRAKLSPGNKIWATFSPPPETDPLSGMPEDTAGIATCLGLGFSADSEPFIIMRYRVDDSSSPNLRRPTIADAGSYSFFRPRRAPDSHWGLTEPLKENPRKLKGRPETIHAQISGKTLVFPYLLST